MENNVVTLETAKKLKAAGFPQTIALAWLEYGADGPGLIEIVGAMRFAAPTAQEIADQLPRYLPYDEQHGSGLFLERDDGKWFADYSPKGLSPEGGPTMAEALAALWLRIHEATIKGQHPQKGESDGA